MIAGLNVEEPMQLRSLAILFCALLLTAPASAATCGGDFSAFLSAMAREAAAAGISRGGRLARFQVSHPTAREARNVAVGHRRKVLDRGYLAGLRHHPVEVFLPPRRVLARRPSDPGSRCCRPTGVSGPRA